MDPTAKEGVAWPELHRARRAIVVVDVVESVRLMQEHEADVIDRWRRFVNEVRTQVLPAHGGRLVKSLGDGMLLEFGNVPDAVAAALQMQRRIEPYNAKAEAAAMCLRVGLHVAEVVSDEFDVYGAGVNLAARLATLAQPGQCVISDVARDDIVDGLDADIEDLGECFLKGLKHPARAFRMRGPTMNPTDKRFVAESEDLRPIVAVLSPSCKGASSDLGVIGDVLADEITVSLSRCAELRVISRLSTASLKQRGADLPVACAGLGAQYIVSGSYSMSGDRVRLRVELCAQANDEVLWADSIVVSAAALLAGDEPGVETILQATAAAIVAQEVRRATSMPLPNVESHALMSAAIALMHRASRSEFDRAHQMLEHLRDRHRNTPQPNAWLAKWHVLRVVQGWSPDPGLDGQRALDAGHRALDGDAGSSLAMTMQGLVHAYLRKDFESAAACYGNALSVNPNESLAMLLLGTMHAFLGEGGPAWAHTQAALRLAPLDPLRYFYLSLSASAAISAQRYDDAIDFAQRSLKANRMHLSTYRALAIAESLAGRHEEARGTVERLLALEPGFTLGRFLDRYPGRARAPVYTAFLAAALRSAGLPD